ncbi:MAG: hypothetical protein ABR860_17165 [Terracidiphilus sp.]
MDNAPNKNDSAANPEKDPLAVGKATSADEPKPPFYLQIPTDLQQQITSFEKKTVRFGYWGLVIASISFAAACVAAWFIFQQFKEMAAQTDLLSRSARQARHESAKSDSTTAQQIAILQGQLHEQQNSVAVVTKQMRQDQRPWLRVEFVPIAGSDPANPRARAQITTGQPISVPIRIRNTGKTPAEIVTANFLIQLAGIDDPMVFPREKNIAKRFRTPKKGTVAQILVNHIETGIIFTDSFTEASLMRTGIENGNKTAIPLSPSESMDILSGRVMIYVTGRIEYFDEFGTPHWTDFCHALSDASANFRCARYNAADSN